MHIHIKKEMEERLRSGPLSPYRIVAGFAGTKGAKIAKKI
jgi:hypothetical protein